MVNSITNESLDPMESLVCLDRINAVIVANTDLEAMMPAVLEEILDIFQCDRAWFMYPCDPAAEQVQVRCERYRPNWPGISQDGYSMPSNAETARFLKLCEAGAKPVRFDPLHNPIHPERMAALTAYQVKSQLAVPLAPNNGPNWVLGIHHCEKPMVYDRVEELFHAVGKRVAHGLSSVMGYGELRESEARFRALVDHAPDAIVVVDADTGQFVEANPAACRMYGVPHERFIGGFGPFDMAEELQPSGEPSVQKILSCVGEALEGKTPKMQCTHKHADGTLFPVEISLARFPDATRNLVCGTIKDLTHQRAQETARMELEKQLSHSQRLETVGQLTGGVAHDFNNLLGVILGNLELLLMEIEEDDPARKFIQDSIAATLKGAKLTKNMLSFARRAPLSPTTLYLNRTLRGICEWSGRTIPATVEMELDLEEGLWPISADPTATESSVLNLMINARDAMSGKGTLTIVTRNQTLTAPVVNEDDLPPGDYVVMTLRDTGTGIEADKISRVFEPFYTTKPTGQGSGLGLSMVHGFMKQSGGAVNVHSEIGVGTAVQLFFPALTAGQDHTGVSVRVIQTPKAARILVAEDQPEVMDIIVRMLQKAGHEVLGAASGDAAFALYQDDGNFDLLLTDIVMPGKLQGPALAAALREITPDLPVVFMTGYAREAALHGNRIDEKDIRLMKPVSRKVLLEAIGAVLSQQTHSD